MTVIFLIVLFRADSYIEMQIRRYMKKNLKFIVGVSVIVISIIYLGVTGFREDYSYYLFADEFIEKLQEFDKKAYEKNFRVAGYVVAGSIDRTTKPVKFKINYNDTTIPVKYIGSGPVPDTFKDNSETVVEGKYTPEGIFLADKIQAKCASKYISSPEKGPIKY